MVDNIDQFGRDTSKNISSSLNEEKSKKILDSLAEIKNQLENKEYNPNIGSQLLDGVRGKPILFLAR